jgi:hypothetical protein
MSASPVRGVIPLLTAQALAFGVMLALLVVPANAIFLNAYGSKWLPATYIAIAVFGSAASALIAWAARRLRLVQVATASLVALAVLYAASWLILVVGGVWVSALLLVLFPIALQMGFVFIGGQAGRLLDVRQLKERFPRIVTGFSVGFLLGGLLGIPLLALVGSTEHLLLATTAAQLVFLALLLATERRFPEVRAAASESSSEVARPSSRLLFASSLVLLLCAYQILSAMGSQLLDFLLYNRAQARYSGNDLTRFLSGFTALLNLADILFLALLAAPLMRRFGLRLGLVLNPSVVAGLLALMALVVAGPGAATFGFFALAGVARISDLVLTDGTTRTSVNASFQVIPVRERLAVQAVVEGIGVPVAIGATGAVLLVMNVLHLGAGAVVVFGVLLSVIWTLTGVAMYRSYTRSLAAEMRRGPLLAPGLEVGADDAALRALLGSDDARDVRLGLDLLGGVEAGPSASAALRRASDHREPEVRVQALVRLAAAGDSAAAAAAAALAGDLARSADAVERRAAAGALGSRGVINVDSRMLIALLDDGDPTVRAAALDAVGPEDAGEPEVVRRVVAAVGEPSSTGSATAALRRLGDAAVPLLAEVVARDPPPRRPRLVRAAAHAACEHPVVFAPALHDPDRAVVLAALDALDAANGEVPPEILDDVFRDAAAHAGRALTARASLEAENESLLRALDDEIDLARRLVIAVLSVRHGDRVRNAVRVVDRADGQRRALGVEALDVILSREEAEIAVPLVRRDLTLDEQAAAIARMRPTARSREEWIAEMAEDPEDAWRSSWLAICARHAAGADHRAR